MSLELLDKTRKINRLLNKHESDKVDFKEFCGKLSETMNVNVILLSRRGKVLGIKNNKDIKEIPQLNNLKYGKYIEEDLLERLSNVLSTQENVNLLTLGFNFDNIRDFHVMLSPIMMGGERLGTLFVYRTEETFSIDDIILLEYGITVIGLAMQRSQSEEYLEEHRKENDIDAALSTLSMLEAKAMLSVIKELEPERSGIVITSRLADKIGITRSVIINALRKCESAGIIRTHSAGMKGTTISIVNELLDKKIIQHYIDLRVKA